MKKQLINSAAKALASYGYEVYISENKEYGFYTDGKRVISFGGCWSSSLDFSGNYISKSCGTGWQIAKEKCIPTKEEADRWIAENPPHWATNGEAVRMATPEQHLKTYGASSGYVKFAG